MLMLCDICNSANSNGFEKGLCHICSGSLEKKLDGLIKEAAGLIGQSGADSFAISTMIPESWISREEDVWDEKFSKCESIKNFINRRIVSAITTATNKKYKTENSDCRISFDFGKQTIKLENQPLFLFGRYKKYSRELSQSRWICKKCEGEGCFKCDYTGKNYTSVEELMGEPIKELFGCDDYTLHASGREDVDVINTAGRPFVLEIKNPKNRKVTMTEIESKVNNKDIALSDVKYVGREKIELVSNSHFDKTYEAKISFVNEVSEKDVEKITALANCVIEQRTPTRVAHRRADLVRKRQIFSIGVLKRDKREILIAIDAEAGTYIKEFISGDKERTKPSIAGALGMKTKCEELKVTAIYDDFLRIIGL